MSLIMYDSSLKARILNFTLFLNGHTFVLTIYVRNPTATATTTIKPKSNVIILNNIQKQETTATIITTAN